MLVFVYKIELHEFASVISFLRKICGSSNSSSSSSGSGSSSSGSGSGSGSSSSSSSISRCSSIFGSTNVNLLKGMKQ